MREREMWAFLPTEFFYCFFSLYYYIFNDLHVSFYDIYLFYYLCSARYFPPSLHVTEYSTEMCIRRVALQLPPFWYANLGHCISKYIWKSYV